MHFTNYDIECIQKAKDFIDADITKHHNIPDIAAYAGLGATRLKVGFKQLYQKSIYQYYHEKSLEKGKYLLDNTDKTIKEISHYLGYRYVVNFVTAFKKQFGKTPYAWRKSNS